MAVTRITQSMIGARSNLSLQTALSRLSRTQEQLTTGRVLVQYQSGAQTRRVRDLPDTGPYVELHPMLADRIGAYDGEQVLISTRRGEVKAPAKIVDTIRPDTVFIPFHWVGANRLTNDALDPSSRMPEFKVCACAVSA